MRLCGLSRQSDVLRTSQANPLGNNIAWKPCDLSSIGWTNCPGLHPGFDESSGRLLRARSGSASISGRPGPTDQRVLTNVMDEVFRLAAAIARGVFDLSADLRERFALPRHFARRDMPFRVTRHAAGLEVGFLVTDRTTHRLSTMTVGAALDGRLVKPALVTLARAVAGRMAVNTAWMGQHLAELGEHGCRPRIRVGDRAKAFRRSQSIRNGLRSCVTRRHAHSKCCDRNEDLKPHVRFH